MTVPVPRTAPRAGRWWSPLPALLAGVLALGAAPPPAAEVQIRLDQAGYSPGVIDGQAGANTRKAVAAFQESRGLERTGEVDPQTWRALLEAAPDDAFTHYRITADDAAGPFLPAIPEDLMAKSRLPALPYASLRERLEEMFHAAPELLRQLNPEASWSAGETIRVPNVAGPEPRPPADALGKEAIGDPEGEPVTVVVSKSRSDLRLLDGEGKILYHAPVTAGSDHDPLPLGEWRVVGIAPTPTFHYDPDLFWDADPAHREAVIPAGPNNPVGVVWIELDKEHYGVHGTPQPKTIGHTLSHGCVRLTNWDAAELAGRVRPGTRVLFVE